MEVNHDNFNFWAILERDLQNIPAHIKNAFHLCGFSNPLSFKDIDDEDIMYVQDFVRKDLGKLLESRKNEKETEEEIENSMFFGAHVSNPGEFVFKNAEIDLIKAIVLHVQRTVDANGVNAGLNYFRNCDENKLQSNFRPGSFFNDGCLKTVADKSTQTSDNVSNSSKAHYFLNKLISAADRNYPREKNGYRFDDDIKDFASYLRMLSGPFAYETLQSNLEGALPSLSSVNKYVANKRKNNIVEGVLQIDGLLEYLNQRNLRLLVSLSEDGTRINGRVQYDSKTNQIVGFALPINEENGMPTPFSYQARDSSEIINHFASDHPTAHFVNVIMAQPLANVAPFCLLLFSSDGKYTAEDVIKRWKFITGELRKRNVTVLTISSDSDPKYNSAMRRNSSLGHKSNLFNNACWFRSGGIVTSSLDTPYYVQDTVHIATKIRNFLLKTFSNPTKLPFGKYFVSMDHVEFLLKTYPKDRHQLTPSVLNPMDRQNFSSVLRICDEKVINLLKKNVSNSEGTVAFLEILRDIISAFMQPSLTPLERVKKMWFAVFILRIWRANIISCKNLTLKENFLTNNCYSCIELNAHSLVHILLYLKENNLQNELLLPLMSSQPCEAFFRKIRSFTSTYSTVANCSVKEIVGRIDKIQYQSDISLNDDFSFPRMKKNDVATRCQLPSKEEISKEIENCKKNALEFAVKIELIDLSKVPGYSLQCKIEPYVPKQKKNTHTVVVPPEDKATKINLSDIKLKDFSEKFADVSIDDTSPYVEINLKNKKIIVKKTSLCWLLRKDTSKLSSDRLLRVRAGRDQIGSSRRDIKAKRKLLKPKFFKQNVYGTFKNQYKKKLRCKSKK